MRWWVAFALALACADLTADDKKPGGPTLKDIKADLDAAQDLLDDGRPSKAAAKLAAAVKAVEAAAGAERIPSGLRQLVDRCKTLKGDLELEGVDVAGIQIPAMASGSRAAAKQPPGGKEGMADERKKNADAFFGKPPPRPAARGAVSFSKDIAPVLVRSCGGCHVTAKKGGFQFTNYAELMQTGVVQRGAGEASRLVEVILSGDMPRGGGKVASDEIGALMKWIDAGAAYDGTDPRQPLGSLGAAAKPAPRAAGPKATVVTKLEPGAVSYKQDVAPVLLAACYSCHGGGEVEEGLNMKTFTTLLVGGRSGPVILPGKGSDSLLVKKLKGKGIDGQRMPLNKTPLADDVIAMIQRWIDEGARLDARSDREELRNIVAAGRSVKLSHEDLAAVRLAAAKNFWSRAIPDEPPEIAGDGDVRVVGNLSPARTATLLAEAESAWRGIAAQLVGEGRPLKGGVIVYALAKPFDFSEWWRQRYGVERPKNVVGAGGLTGDIAYAALLVPPDDAQADIPLLLAEQLAAAAVAARGVPEWFAQGAGRAVAMKVAPAAPLAKAWRKQPVEALPAVGSPEDFLAGMPADEAAARAVAGGFVSALAGSGSRLREMIAQLDDQVPFDQAFQAVFRGSPADLFKAWAAREAAGNRRR